MRMIRIYIYNSTKDRRRTRWITLWLIETFSDRSRIYAFMKDGIHNKAKPALYNTGDDLQLANGTPTTTKECHPIWVPVKMASTVA
jgi:hypothetical protein